MGHLSIGQGVTAVDDTAQADLSDTDFADSDVDDVPMDGTEVEMDDITALVAGARVRF